MDKVHISVVTPVYGCSGNLEKLYERLEKTLSSITNNFEIIMVNDASPDNPWDTIVELSKNDKRVKGINLSRNFGQHYAILAGLKHSAGEWIVVMDCDLQDQPEEIIKLYEQTTSGYDIVFGRREKRQDNFLKKLSSKLFYNLLSYLTGTKQDSSIANFGIYHKKAIKALLSMGDEIRYFPVMIRWVGFNSCAVNIKHAERIDGESSYSWSSLLNLATDIMLSFSDKPLKIAVKMGFSISFVSFLISLYILLKVLLFDISVPGWASTVMSLWFLGGLIIMVLGIVGIYVGKTFDQTKQRPLYIIKETTWK